MWMSSVDLWSWADIWQRHMTSTTSHMCSRVITAAGRLRICGVGTKSDPGSHKSKFSHGLPTSSRSCVCFQVFILRHFGTRRFMNCFVVCSFSFHDSWCEEDGASSYGQKVKG